MCRHLAVGERRLGGSSLLPWPRPALCTPGPAPPPSGLPPFRVPRAFSGAAGSQGWISMSMGRAGPPGKLVNKPPAPWGRARGVNTAPFSPRSVASRLPWRPAWPFWPRLILSLVLSSRPSRPGLVAGDSLCPTRLVPLRGSEEAINPAPEGPSALAPALCFWHCPQVPSPPALGAPVAGREPLPRGQLLSCGLEGPRPALSLSGVFITESPQLQQWARPAPASGPWLQGLLPWSCTPPPMQHSKAPFSVRPRALPLPAPAPCSAPGASSLPGQGPSTKGAGGPRQRVAALHDRMEALGSEGPSLSPGDTAIERQADEAPSLGCFDFTPELSTVPSASWAQNPSSL